MVDSLPNGLILHKDTDNTNNPVRRYHVGRCTQKVTQFCFKLLQTKTPPLVFTEDLIWMMANISSLVNVYWFMGKHVVFIFLSGI
jgi:hypothetical protein